jgi:ribonucleoside-diphosphate reductase subunit M2
MESPVKKLDFSGKENAPFNADAPVEVETEKPALETSKDLSKTASVAPTIKAEEADEPLLQENPQRFVLFPIKYHEVRRVRRVLDAYSGFETRHD